jgi:hypothetical protein
MDTPPDNLIQKVNELLAGGQSYAEIAQANPELAATTQYLEANAPDPILSTRQPERPTTLMV